MGNGIIMLVNTGGLSEKIGIKIPTLNPHQSSPLGPFDRVWP